MLLSDLNYIGSKRFSIFPEASGNFMVATGGTIITDGDYKIHIFTANGFFTVLKLGNGLVEYLMTGGGAGGGLNVFNTFSGGGGSAGEYKTDPTFLVALGSLAISIGIGGLGATVNGNDGANGGNTTFGLLTAIGGGYGGGPGFAPIVAGSGAYGGGGAAAGGLGGNGIIAFKGGNGSTGFGGAGGGGGAGGAAPNAPNTNGGAVGGVGIANAITGALITYCKGGDGGGNTTPGNGQDGVNYGDGGGGNYKGSGVNTGNAGNGKQGVVIIRYKYK